MKKIAHCFFPDSRHPSHLFHSRVIIRRFLTLYVFRWSNAHVVMSLGFFTAIPLLVHMPDRLNGFILFLWLTSED
jgi:hypothetical protein